MATVRAETFDVEMFGKMVALFDSNKAGEARERLSKGGADVRESTGCASVTRRAWPSGRVTAARLRSLQDELRRQEARTRGPVNRGCGGNRTTAGATGGAVRRRRPDGREHVIDLPGRLRRAWRFPQFRLFVLTVMIGAGAVCRGSASARAGAVSRAAVPLSVRRVERGAVPQARLRADVPEVAGVRRGPSGWARCDGQSWTQDTRPARVSSRPRRGAGADALEGQRVAWRTDPRACVGVRACACGAGMVLTL